MHRYSRFSIILTVAAATALCAGVSSTASAAVDKTPAISSMSAHIGAYKGGTKLTITGRNFTKKSQVGFDTTPVKSIHFVSSKKLVVISPTRVNGGWNTRGAVVRVFNGTHHSASTKNTQFTYVDAPKISKVRLTGSPSAGSTIPTTGGTLTLDGLDLQYASRVTVDGAPTGFSVTSGELLTVTAPPHAVGDVALTVTSPYGASNSERLTYTDPKIDPYGPNPTNDTEIAGSVVSTSYVRLANVDVYLYGVDSTGGSRFIRQTTSTIGLYSFTGLTPGLYKVCFFGEDGTSAGPTPVASGGTSVAADYGFADMCAGAVAWNGRESEVPTNAATVAAWQSHITTVNAYLPPAAMIAGYVDGAGGDLNSVVAWLLKDGVAYDYSVSDTDDSGNDGLFVFTGLSAGNYTVCFDASYVAADTFAPHGYASSCTGGAAWSVPPAPPGSAPPGSISHSLAAGAFWDADSTLAVAS